MSLFNKKKRIKVIGKIVRFEFENNKHYPVFAFTTLSGHYYEIRSVPKNNEIKETSLEDVYIESGVIEKLNEPLPIEDITIKYLEEEPTDFFGIWI